jgi:hypothetical protein
MFKRFAKVNRKNSNAQVTCHSKENCCMRHTTSCETCKLNYGTKRDKNCYVPR